MITFEQYLNSLQPPLSQEDKQLAIEQHEIRERRALCHRSALREWSFEQAMLPKQTSGTSLVIKELQYQVAALEKQLEERPSYTSKEVVSEF
jgi:hypothetical protein